MFSTNGTILKNANVLKIEPKSAQQVTYEKMRKKNPYNRAIDTM